MTKSVLIANHFFDDTAIERRILDEADAEVYTATVDTRADLRRAADGAAAVVNPPYSFAFDLYEDLPDLEVVAVMGVGVDHVNLDGATAHGVEVVHVPDYCVEEVSTHALALLLAAVRRIRLYDTQLEVNNWEWRTGRPIPRLAGRTLGFVGFGRIARRLAEKVEGFEFERIAHDPYVSRELAAEYGVELVNFDALLARSDFVSIHAPATEETVGLFDADAFAAMGDGVIVVNTSRGAIVDEAVLCDALDRDRVAAAGLDVFESEPTDDDNPLLIRDDVVTTPHVGWYSETATEALRKRVARDVARVLLGERPANSVLGD